MNDEEKSLSHYNIGDILITKSGDVLVGTSDGLNIYIMKRKMNSIEFSIKIVT